MKREVIMMLALGSAAVASEIQQEWTKQWGTILVDKGYSVATDADDNIFVTGETGGDLDGNTNSSLAADIFLTKLDNNGTKLWTRQWGSSDADYGQSVATDRNGNVFVSGYTYGSLDGGGQYGSADIFLTKLDNNGTRLWTRQWDGGNAGEGRGVATDAHGNVYVSGYVSTSLNGQESAGNADIFLIKLDSNGTELWTAQWGSIEENVGNGVAVDAAGNIYVSGVTEGALEGNTHNGGEDIFLTKLDSEGNRAWTKQWGTDGNDRGYGVATDGSGNILVTGDTSDGFLYDSFLAKFDSSGGQTWSQTWGTVSWDIGRAVVAAADGSILVTGNRPKNLDGTGDSDIFLAKFDSSGTQLWSEQWGTDGLDTGYGVALDSNGSALVTGAMDTGGSDETILGIFLTKYQGDGSSTPSDGVSISLTAGWNLVGNPQATAFATSNIPNSSEIWRYAQGQWDGAGSVNPCAGFWVKATQTGSVRFTSGGCEITADSLSSGWNLLGAGQAIEHPQEGLGGSVVWRFEADSGWQKNPASLSAGEGFWIKK